MKITILNVSILLFVLTGCATASAALAAGKPQVAAVSVVHSSKNLPAALRPVFYRTLSANMALTHTFDSAGCTAMLEPSFRACFDKSGAHFTGAALPISLQLVAFGRDNRLSPVAAVQPVIERNRVNYAHGAMTEWWQVLPIGLEQGFTLAKRPGGDGKLTLAIATSVRARKQNGMLAWGKLRYGELVVTDATGRTVPSTLEDDGTRVLVAINDAHAVYPLTVDPLVWLAQKVAASDGVGGDGFGYSVAVSGATAIIGAHTALIPDYQYSQGAAYVFTESNGTWTQTAKLSASDGVGGDRFGTAVALEDRTAVVGAPYAGVSGNAYQGAVYVFQESNGSWTQTAKLTAGDGATGDFFGWSLALSHTTLLIGAPDATMNGNTWQGAAYVFSGSGGNWTQAAKLTAGDGAAFEYFGIAVALSGTTALIGGSSATINGNFGQGAAYLFTPSGNSWTQVQELTAGDGAAADKFGSTVAIDGTTALVGAPNATIDGKNYQGAAYVFDEANGTWIQAAKLTASDGSVEDFFGHAVALSGTTALIGANCAQYDPNTFLCGPGAAYLYTESAGNWTQTQVLTESGGAPNDVFGDSVALSDLTALIGADQVSVYGNDGQGAAYFYGGSDLDLAVGAPQTVQQGQPYASQTIATNNSSAASPAVTATMTVPAAASFLSATASQGSCSEAFGLVTCAFGPINGNAGTATADITLKATGSVGDTIADTASVTKTTPPLTAGTVTAITSGIACPDGYAEYDGSLDAGKRTHSPIYQAPAGEENAILTASQSGFQLFAGTEIGGQRKIYRIPGNEIHRQAPAGRYTWIVEAGNISGSYTLCVLHP